MADEWDDDSTSANTCSAPAFQPFQSAAPSGGITFGGRGRGFTPAESGRGGRGGFNRGGGDRGGRSFGDRPRRDNNEDGDGGFKRRGGDDEGFRRRNGDEEGGRKYPPRDRNGGEGGEGGFKKFGGGDNEGEANGEEGVEKPKPQTYIPPDVTEDEAELYGSGISSGINFSKYDNIPVKVTGDDVPPGIETFADSGLRKFLIEKVQKCNYTKPTPVQKRAIPIVLKGRDVMACAQTGSGKTAAFLLPIIHALLADPEECFDGDTATPQAVIIAPTRELAVQIMTEGQKFTLGTSIIPCVIYGGTQVGHQVGKLKKGCHILVATPGRLLDFVDRKRVSFSKLRFLVLDEADRMLDMGFQPAIDKMVNDESMVPKTDRQTLMFSATFPDEIQRMASRYLNNYLFIAVGVVGGACSDVEQRFVQFSRPEKLEGIIQIMNEVGLDRTLIFVETKRFADYLGVCFSERSIPSTTMHGDREQHQREEALRDFRCGKMKVLIATAVASRGLDIKDVKHVINYDLPKEIDEYVHRIGRTGRLGNKGVATSCFDPDKDASLAPSLVRILQQAGQEVPDFLMNASGGCVGVGNDFNSSGFGGQDTRKGGFSKPSQNHQAAPQEADDEKWD